MNSPVAKKRAPEKQGLEPDLIRIGKDVIEILTSGMYVSPVTVYREYIQNAADSIDIARSQGLLTPSSKHGEVSVEFNHSARSVTIRDSGAGISVRDAVPVLVAMGASPKRGTKARGFRGVGRLSGLAYCRELEFRTKASGDGSIVSVTWDCRGLRERLADSAFGGDLKRIVSDVVSVSYEKAEDSNEHFFEVRMMDIARLRNDLLLNEKVISHYLAQVAPVPFSPEFSFGHKITTLLSNYAPQTPLDLSVAGERIFRPYRDTVAFPATAHTLQMHDVEFIEFPNVDGMTGAVAWLAHHEYVRSIPPSLGIRGLRARVGDLQVGESNLFDDSFKEPRFNGWTIGEIHIYDSRIVPNGRRDNFEVNHHYYNLQVQLGPLAAKIAQHCRSASVSRNAEQTIRNVVNEVTGRLRQKRACDRAELSRLKSAVLRSENKAKRVVHVERRKQLEAGLVRLQKKLVKLTPKRGASVVAFNEVAALISKHVTNRTQAGKLIEALQKLCR